MFVKIGTVCRNRLSHWPGLPKPLLTLLSAGQDNTPAANPVTDVGALLGRLWFYDKRLSSNQTLSCSSSHEAEHGFSDPRPFSVVFDGRLTGRKSMVPSSTTYYLNAVFFGMNVPRRSKFRCCNPFKTR